MSVATVVAPEDLKPAQRLVAVPEYYHLPEEPKTFADLTSRLRAKDHPLGLWNIERESPIPADLERQILADRDVFRRVIERDLTAILAQSRPERFYLKRDGLDFVVTPENRVRALVSELFAENIITDNGATSLLKNLWNSSGSAVAIGSHILISFGNQGCTTLTSAYTSGVAIPATLAVNSTPASIPANAQIIVSYGTANAETILITNATQAAASTSLTLAGSQGNWAHNHSIGDNVVVVPLVSDNPSSLSNSADSGAQPSGDFTFSGSGVGNRQVSIAFTFGTSTTAGNYTEAYTTNAGTMAANASFQHLIFPGQTVNSSTSLTLTIVNKL